MVGYGEVGRGGAGALCPLIQHRPYKNGIMQEYNKRIHENLLGVLGDGGFLLFVTFLPSSTSTQFKSIEVEIALFSISPTDT